MNADSPTDRTSFDSAMTAVYAEHATLRRLAAGASKQPGYSADDALSLADAMTAHESAEDGLFPLPFLTRPPRAVAATAAEARRRCDQYVSGDYRLANPGVAIALFVDALLAHLAVEEAWLADENEHQKERLRISA